MRKILIFLFLLLCPVAQAQEVVVSYSNSTLPVLNEELRKTRGDIRNTSDLISSLQTSMTGLFDVSTGHNHDGSNSRKVLATDLDTTGLQVDGVLYNDNGTISSRIVDDSNAISLGYVVESTSNASGDVQVTGMGFQPIYCTFYTGTDVGPGGQDIFQIGHALGSLDYYIGLSGASGSTYYDMSFTQIWYQAPVAGEYTQYAILKSFDPDGFTYTRTRAGSRGGSGFKVIYVCHK